MRTPRIAVLVACVCLLVGGVAFAAAPPPVPYTPPCTASTDACRQQRIVALEAKASALEGRLAALETPAPTVPPTTTAPPTTTDPPTPTPTPTPPTPTSTTPPPPGWPTAATTGIPAGTVLSAYTGPCRVTTANTVIDAKTISCTLEVVAAGVQVKRSRLSDGIVQAVDGAGSFTVTDSDITVAANETAVGDANFVVERSDISGGNRGVNCYDNCTVRDSFIHGNRITGSAHASGMRAGQNTVFERNSIVCDAPDTAHSGGCSADLTMYGDFTTVHHVTVAGNLLRATPGGFCAYGGSSAGKPFPNAHHVVFTGNVFERGDGKCGYWGAITSFEPSATGNAWSGNTWDDGAAVGPS